MASSGLLSTSNQYVKYWIEVIVNSQNIANNTSNITVKVWAKRTNTGYTTWGNGSVTLKVDGAYYNSGTKEISISNNSVLLHSWTGNTGHAADGTKTLTVYAAINIPSILSSSEQAYSENLTTIPRTSSFTVNKTVCELGTPFTVSISRASSSFTHSVSYVIGGSERRYLQEWNSTSTTCSATPPITDAVYSKSSTSMGITVIVDTYLGSRFIGSTSKTITLTIPSSVIPTISSVTATLVDGTWGKYIKGKSKVKLTANGVGGVYGSSVTSVKFEGGGYSNTDTASPWEYTTGLLNTAGNNVFIATVTDSRGRTNRTSVTVLVTDYYAPSFADAWCVRCLSDGTTDLNGTYIKVLINLNYDTVGGSNTRVVKYRYRPVGGTWSSYISVTNNVVTAARAGFSTDVTYEVELYGADYFTSITPKIVILQTAVFPVDFLVGNKGVAFGKAAELDDIADFAYNALFRKNIEVQSGNKVDASAFNLNGYKNWDSGGFNDTGGGAAIVNDNGTYKALMILGNRSAGGSRKIEMWDSVNINGPLSVYTNPIVSYKKETSSTHIKQSIRFYDGTAIEHCTTYISQMTLNTQAGAIWHSPTYTLGAWLRAFVDYPAISMTVSNTANFWYTGNKGESPTHSGSMVFFGAGGGTWNLNFYIHCIGIGRWKV